MYNLVDITDANRSYGQKSTALLSRYPQFQVLFSILRGRRTAL
jgi:hypothetical protein